MSDQRENRFELRRDGLGIVLFTMGAFFSVLIVLALTSSQPLERAEGTAALARIWAGSIGLAPAFVFCGGSAFLGAHLFLVGRGSQAGAGAKRHVGSLALVSLGLSVLLGAFSSTSGGLLGDFTAGAVSRSAHVALGALVGIGVFGGAVWLAWLRPARLAQAAPTSMEEPHPVASPHLDQGVSAAEAAALIPEGLSPWQAEPRKPTPGPSIPSIVIPTYREDVRRRGDIPEGARLLHPSHVHTPTPPGSSRPIDDPSASSVQHWTPPGEPGDLVDAAGEDLARAEELRTSPRTLRATAEAAGEAEIEEELIAEDAVLEDRVSGERAPEEPAPEEPLPEESTADEADDEERFTFEPSGRELAADDARVGELPLLEMSTEDFEEERELELVAEEPDLEPDDEPGPRRAIPVLRPSWEQPSLFEAGEEPVDAYGTPMSVVESVREPAKNERHPDAVSSEAERIAEAPDAEAPDAEAGDAEEPEADQVLTEEVGAEDRDVVLKPAAPRPKKKGKPRGVPKPRSRLLAEVGCLLVDQGRVAVSMLQKQYDMDFEEATKVLDELQSLGLIGPYLGGHRRDILLSRDEWLEKVSSL